MSLKSRCDSCTQCNYWVNMYGGAVFADGSEDASVLVVGEAPGQYEQRTLLPFTHFLEWKASRCVSCVRYEKCYPPSVIRQRAYLPELVCSYEPVSDSKVMEDRVADKSVVPYTVSSLLNDAVVKAGLSRDCWNNIRRLYGKDPVKSPFYITNIVKCRPVRGGENKAPSVSCSDSCIRWLSGQIELIKPKALLILGAVAGKALLGKSFSITQSSGTIVPASDYDLPDCVEEVGFSFHPSAIERSPSEKPKMVEQLNFVVKELGNRYKG